MRLATLDADGWELRSAETAHAKSPTTFWIPSLEDRLALRRGQGVKLLFDVQIPAEHDRLELSGERMWVVVSHRVGEHYVGRLVNQPSDLAEDDEHYLHVGAEIPFATEHVADIDDPPIAYAQRILSAPPTRRWPADTGV